MSVDRQKFVLYSLTKTYSFLPHFISFLKQIICLFRSARIEDAFHGERSAVGIQILVLCLTLGYGKRNHIKTHLSHML